MTPKTLTELADHVGGTVQGDGTVPIRSAATLEEAGEDQVTFFNNKLYAPLLKTTRAGAVIVKEPVECSRPLLVVEDPYFAFAQLVILLHGHRQHPKTDPSPKASIHPEAVLGQEVQVHDFVTISAGARIGDRTVLYPGVFIGPDTEVGDDCILYPNVVVYDRCRLGNRVILQANTSIGQDGFGYATHKGVHHKIPHIGGVILEDDVEIGANASIERGTLHDTIIGAGAKIGDSVVIGHGTRLGGGSLLVAQVGIAGSSTLGKYCVIGGKSAVAGHLKIGNQVTIAAHSGVNRNLEDGERVFGAPAFDIRKAIPAYATIKSLPDMKRKLRDLDRRLEKVEGG